MTFDATRFRTKKLPAISLLATAAVALVVLNLADYALTMVGLNLGLGREANPLFLPFVGTWTGLLIKTAIVGLVSAWAFFYIKRTKSSLAVRAFIAVVWAYFAIVSLTAVQLLLST